MRFFLIAVSLFLIAGTAQANPFAKRTEQPVKIEQTFISKNFASFLMYQRKISQKITGYMKAIQKGESLIVILTAVGLAFIYGVIHAIGPGHGKVFLATYFMSYEAKWWRGLAMGLLIGITHVSSAVIFIWLADSFVKYVMGVQTSELMWVKLVSYGAIIALGLFMLIKSIIKNNGDEHSDCDGSLRSLFLLGLGIGIVPCPGALLIMLYAMTKGMILLGIGLVSAMALGMGLTLSAIGLLVINGRKSIIKAFENRNEAYQRLIATLEISGSLLIIFIGFVFFISAL